MKPRILGPSRFAIGVLAILLVVATAVQAGPPLICHSIAIGQAKSLPWTSGSWNLSGNENYDLKRLVPDTMAILDSKAPVLVRMETLRRATLYARKNRQVAKELLTRLHARATAAETTGHPDALAWFDAGYLAESYKQWIGKDEQNPATGLDGYAWVKKAIGLRGQDPQMEFAAALITLSGPEKDHKEHVQNAMAGAKGDPLLAQNLAARFAGNQGETSSLSITPAQGVLASPPSDLRFAVGTAPGSVAIADFNGDGKLDIVTANEQSGDASVLLGDGRGGFSPAPGSPFSAGHSPNDIAVGDFNRDGWLDLAFANHETEQLTVLLGDGRGRFAPAPHSPFTVAVRPHPHGIATGDFNGDGNLDLVTDSWADNRLEILFGDGKGSFAAPGSYVAVGKHPYQRVRVADLNGDGKADIVSPNLEGDNVTILLSDAKGGFRQPPGSPFPCGDSPFSVAIGDVNGDGIPDLAIVNSPSSTTDRSGQDGLTILIGDGRGGFTTMTGSPFVTPKRPNMVAIGDANGDGVADVVVSNPDSDTITIFMMSRKGSVAARSTLSIPGHPKGLAIRDLNSDGKADIVVTNTATNAVTVILGK